MGHIKQEIDLTCENRGSHFIINEVKQKFNTEQGLIYSNRYNNFVNKLSELYNEKNLQKELNIFEINIFYMLFDECECEHIYTYDDFLYFDKLNVCLNIEICEMFFIEYCLGLYEDVIDSDYLFPEYKEINCQNQLIYNSLKHQFDMFNNNYYLNFSDELEENYLYKIVDISKMCVYIENFFYQLEEFFVVDYIGLNDQVVNQILENERTLLFKYIDNKKEIEKHIKKNKYKKARKYKTYLMKNKLNGLYKIGKSINPKYREKTLQSQEPEIEMVKVWQKDIENDLHFKYKKYRKRGEWFKLNKTQVKHICTKY
jgi:hypothetical protein